MFGVLRSIYILYLSVASFYQLSSVLVISNMKISILYQSALFWLGPMTKDSILSSWAFPSSVNNQIIRRGQVNFLMLKTKQYIVVNILPDSYHSQAHLILG